jgi:hypothetical protein
VHQRRNKHGALEKGT